MHKGLMAVGAIAVAGASAAVGWYGVKYLFQTDTTASPTASASPATVSLAYDATAIAQQATGLFEAPACGETWASEPVAANGIKPVVDVESSPTQATARVSFVSDSPGITAFLVQEGQLIVTRNDIVVTPDWGSEFVPQLRMSANGAEAGGTETYDITGPSLCDVAGELSALWNGFDWNTATEAEAAKQREAAAQFEAAHKNLPPGEYKVYAWSPIIQGEPAAIARLLTEEGLSDLSLLQYTIGYSPLADDARIAEYCTESTTPAGDTEKLCDVPQEVLTEVLTRDVPESYVVDAKPSVAVSEPLTFTVQ